MDPKRSETVKQLFARASALGAEERVAFLAEVRSQDAEIGLEVESLLAVADRADPFFEELGHVLSLSPWSVEPQPEITEEGEPLLGCSVHQYRIETKLGSGGMGVVYRAQDTQLDRTVALKFLPVHLAADEVATERFLIEARAAAALDHPNVCTIHEIGRAESGRPFIAMAFYDGETLKQKLARGPLTVEEATSYAAQIAAGLSAAHVRGVVHRDIKPGNVIVTSEGVAKVLDFGLAKLADVTLTGTGVTPGTVAYMSPEHTRGEKLDERTDLWSLGVVLYEMVTGRRPFRGDRQGVVIHAIRNDEPRPPSELCPDLPSDVEQIVFKLLRKSLGERYRSANSLLADLASWVPSAAHVARAHGRRGPGVIRGVAGVTAIVAIMGGAVAAALTFLPGRADVPLDPYRVAVAVLQNRTGEEALDALGRQAAERITQGVQQREVAVVVPTEVALAVASAATESGRGIDAVTALARASGAGIVIHGAYYLVEDSLHFQLQITDVVAGEVMSALKPLAVPRESSSEALSLLHQRTLGALAAALDLRAGDLQIPVQPPSLAAYRLYRLGWDAHDRWEPQEALDYFQRALAVDSTWMSPLVMTALTLSNTGRYAAGDSLLRVAASHLELLSEPEHLAVQVLLGHEADNEEAKLRNVRRLATLAPSIGLQWGYWSAWQAYRPQEALDFLARIDTTAPRFGGLEREYWIFAHRTRHMLAEREEELEVVREARRRFPEDRGLLNRQLETLAAFGQTTEIEALLDTAYAMQATPDLPTVVAVRELRAHGFPAAAQIVARAGLDRLDGRPSEEVHSEEDAYRWFRADLLYELGRFREALDLYEVVYARLSAKSGGDPKIDRERRIARLEAAEVMTSMACAAARLGDVDRAQKIDAAIGHELEQVSTSGWDPERIYSSNLFVGRARIAAVLGDRENAVRLLQEGFELSRHKGNYAEGVHQTSDFESLHDYLPFQQLLKPRG